LLGKAGERLATKRKSRRRGAGLLALNYGGR
jgi:hypothetical protein